MKSLAYKLRMILYTLRKDKGAVKMEATLYILKGYVTKQGGCNIVQVYKTKSAAKKRFDKMVKSGCYEFVEMIEKINNNSK